MSREKRILAVLSALMIYFTISSGLSNSASKKSLGLIPLPAQMALKPGVFQLNEQTSLILSPVSSEELKKSAEIFAQFLKVDSGLSLKISEAKTEKGFILFELKQDPALKNLGKEAYILDIEPERILVSSTHPSGLFYGAMTLLQVFQSSYDNRSAVCLNILDYPRFPHRGLLLDPARNFLSMEKVKQVLDAMARIKLNVLHFHLTDDQGWRIESKVFPKLHQVGGKDGYYTQEQLKELVAYAQARQITIQPEIDVPGHSTALLAAYPELSCSGKPVEVSKIFGIHSNILCPGKDEVYVFLDKLFREVAEIFPSYYIHTGSDEVLAKDWDDFAENIEIEKNLAEKGQKGLQCYFVNRLNKTFLDINRRMIVWDEMADCLPEGAVAQAWRSTKPIKPVTASGHGVVVSPVDPWYLDYPDWPWKLKRVYLFEPVPDGMSDEQEKLVLGGQGNLWGERAPERKIMAKLFPRALAVSEVLWSKKELRDWQSFKRREAEVEKSFAQQGVRFIILFFPKTGN